MSEQERLEKIQTVTRYFPYWQGLKLIPAGVFLLIVAAIYKLDGTPQWWAVYVLGLLIFVIGTQRLSRWYGRLFGVVSNPGVNRRLDLASVLIFAPLVFVSIILDLVFKLPVSLYALTLAGGLVWTRQVTGGGRPHYLWVAGLMALVALTPTLLGSVHDTVQFALAVGGLGMIVIGVLDHLELTRIFKPVEEDEHGTPA